MQTGYTLLHPLIFKVHFLKVYLEQKLMLSLNKSKHFSASLSLLSNKLRFPINKQSTCAMSLRRE